MTGPNDLSDQQTHPPDIRDKSIVWLFPGELLKTYGYLYARDIPLFVHDIALSDDGGTLALACGKNGVHLYKITMKAHEESDSFESDED